VRRIGLAVALAVSILVAPLAAGAQQAKSPVRIGILTPPDPYTTIDVFRRGFRDLGYNEGADIHLEYRSSGGHDDRFPGLAADLVALNVDIIIAATPTAIRAAQGATKITPIVMVLSADPVRSGLVKSHAWPGGNTTGPAALTVDLMPKRLEFFKAAVPSLRQIAVVTNPVFPGVRESVTDTVSAARTLGVTVRSFEVRTPAELETAFAGMIRARPEGLLLMPDPVTSSQMAQIVDFTTRHRLPAMNGRRLFPERGGLMSYGIDFAEHVRAGIRYVDKILKGAKPADLPVEQPTKYELVINLKTAKALGITIPQSVLLRADEVIQ